MPVIQQVGGPPGPGLTPRHLGRRAGAVLVDIMKTWQGLYWTPGVFLSPPVTDPLLMVPKLGMAFLLEQGLEEKGQDESIDQSSQCYPLSSTSAIGWLLP